MLLRRHVERCLRHAQRLQNAAVQELAQALPGNHFHDPAQHIGGPAIFPLRARLMRQRQRRQARRLILVGLAATVDLGVHIRLLHRPGATELIAQARGMAQQILHRGLTLRRHQFHLPVPLHQHFLPGEGGNEFRYRVVQQQPPFLPQHHDGHRDNRLGHGIDAEQAVGLHGVGSGGIAFAECLQIGQPVVANDGNHRPRYLPGCHALVQHAGQAGQPIRAKPDLAGVGNGQGVRVHDNGSPGSVCFPEPWQQLPRSATHAPGSGLVSCRSAMP